MKDLTKIFFVLFFGTLVSLSFAQEDHSTDKKEKKECARDCCSGHKQHSSLTMAQVESDSTLTEHNQMKSEVDKEFSIVRQGEIDLTAVDLNGDGKVYQDQMCWNVLSDEAGECPQCGMILKEVSIEKAKENLLKHDFKVKENK